MHTADSLNAKMKPLVHITTVVITVLALDPYLLFLHAGSQVADIGSQCNNICSVTAAHDHTDCQSRNLDRIPSQCHTTVYLVFSLNNLQFIDQTSFAAYENLRFVFLDNNRIRNITPGAFSACHQLRYLYLQMNPLIRLRGDTFLGASSLEQLYLTDTSLEVIESDAFRGLSSIQRIYLNNNHLRTLPNNVFHNLQTLQILLIQNNQLLRLESRLFQGLVSLNSLNISQNEITTVQNGALDFTKLANLEEIDISNNNIVSVTNFSRGMVNIPRLFLIGNPISCGCENKALADWYNERVRLDPSVASDRRYEVICRSPREHVDIPLRNISFTTCKEMPDSVTPYVVKSTKVSATLNINPVKGAADETSKTTTTREDMYMFVGIAVLFLCVVIVVVAVIGVYISESGNYQARTASICYSRKNPNYFKGDSGGT